jgi:hypothetical protein
MKQKLPYPEPSLESGGAWGVTVRVGGLLRVFKRRKKEHVTAILWALCCTFIK